MKLHKENNANNSNQWCSGRATPHGMKNENMQRLGQDSCSRYKSLPVKAEEGRDDLVVSCKMKTGGMGVGREETAKKETQAEDFCWIQTVECPLEAEVT